MHYFGASAMVLMVSAHMAQTFFVRLLQVPARDELDDRRVAPRVHAGDGVQLLRWDQTATWSVVIAAEQSGRVPWIGNFLAQFILGGTTIGGATLSRFFAIHVFIMPALMFVFIGFHLLLVLRHGIAEPPTAGRPVDPATYRAEYEQLMHNGPPILARWRVA
jgi:ubiquinol-cytochrome c reductase cytochrome b subunit